MAEERSQKNNRILKWSGGGTIVAIMTFFIGYVDSRVNEIEAKVDYEVKDTKQYVDKKHVEVKEDLKDIKKILMKMDDRLFNLYKKQSKE